MNKLQERIEKNTINRAFQITVPEAYYKEFFGKVDSFCKARYGDVRWVMLESLIDNAEVDWKYASLFDEIEMLKARIFDLETNNKVVAVSQPKPAIKSFGSQEVTREKTGEGL